MDFEWDPIKASSNASKHGIQFEEAATVFGDPLARTRFDPDHSAREDRFVTLGLSMAGKLLVVSYTDRAEVIRIISARPATKRESRNHGHG